MNPWEAQFWLDDSPGNSLHTKLLNQLTLDIQRGRLAPGFRLPGSRALAVQLGVNRKTVQQVYEELEAQGWLVTRQRSGTFVSENLPEQGLSPSSQRLVSSTHRAKAPSELLESLYQDAVGAFPATPTANDGTPDSRLIPYALLARTYRRVCIHLSRQSKLGYGDPRGSIELRESVRNMLSSDRFMNCSTEQVCIVRGSQMGIFLAARILDPGKGAIVVEALCYPPAKATFEANGFTVLKCPLDERGLSIECLQQILKQHTVAGVYVTPHHQYPTTVSLPMDRRLALLELSRSFKFAVLEDDYDHEFHYGSKPIPPLASLPNSENVVHIGSMSKVFAPGLRLGYMAADVRFIERAAQEIVLIDRQGNTLSELVLAELMASGEVRRHIRKTRKEYEARRNFAAREFDRVFGDRVSFTVPTGGMAIWVDISKLLAGRNLDALPGKDSTLSTLYTDDRRAPTHLRFGFGALSEKEIRQSIQQLAKTLSG
ncbi:PLP-dependent aminotransferase family protein [Parahaliea mediterranea]|uniref:MocR-like pyridoxine biosynthesis transcription factor PdxR n=1 Tax=Parahaliea mediterranea TaxID=651086 RepID=UPI000E2E9DFB|nr:PLP-dependent aminotransferase family protein [Parahaliea mediterranea]